MSPAWFFFFYLSFLYCPRHLLVTALPTGKEINENKEDFKKKLNPRTIKMIQPVSLPVYTQQRRPQWLMIQLYLMKSKTASLSFQALHPSVCETSTVYFFHISLKSDVSVFWSRRFFLTIWSQRKSARKIKSSVSNKFEQQKQTQQMCNSLKFFGDYLFRNNSLYSRFNRNFLILPSWGKQETLVTLGPFLHTANFLLNVPWYALVLQTFFLRKFREEICQGFSFIYSWFHVVFIFYISVSQNLPVKRLVDSFHKKCFSQ